MLYESFVCVENDTMQRRREQDILQKYIRRYGDG
jgi:hypothetical protein